MVQSSVLIMMVVTQGYTCDKIAENYTHTQTQVHEQLVKYEGTVWIISMPTCFLYYTVGRLR